MNRIILISGPCGSGKSTFADLYARHLVRQGGKPVYLIHGDAFHAGFIEPEDDEQPAGRVPWEDILRFNWDCILATAARALAQDLDVAIDYVVETELPQVKALADAHGAKLYYIVLTASEQALERRIRRRGDAELIERALFLRRELEAMPENRGHLYDNTGKTPRETVREIDLDRFIVELGSREQENEPS